MTRTEHSKRPARESLSKRLGKVAKQIAARDCNRCAYCSRTAEESTGHLAHHARQPHNNQVPAQNTITALDADGDEFALDFGFPAVTTRPLTPTVETTRH